MSQRKLRWLSWWNSLRALASSGRRMYSPTKKSEQDHQRDLHVARQEVTPGPRGCGGLLLLLGLRPGVPRLLLVHRPHACTSEESALLDETASRQPKSCQAGPMADGGTRHLAVEALGQCGPPRDPPGHHRGLGRDGHRCCWTSTPPLILGLWVLRTIVVYVIIAFFFTLLMTPATRFLQRTGDVPRRGRRPGVPPGRAGADRLGLPVHRAAGDGRHPLRPTDPDARPGGQEGPRPAGPARASACTCRSTSPRGRPSSPRRSPRC